MTEIATHPGRATRRSRGSRTGSAGAASTAAPAAAARSTTRRPGARPAPSTSRRVEEVDAAVQAARAAFPAWRATSLAKRAELFFRIRELLHARRDEVAEILDARARQGLLRRARRGDARARGRRVLLRHPDAAQGRALRAGLDRDRRLLDPAAARRRRRHHAVQLPRDGAHVDVGAGDRVRQLLRAQAVGEGSVRVALGRRAAAGGRPAGRRLQRRHGRQVAVDALLEHPDVAAISLRRLDADRALRLRERRPRAASAARRSAARRTT